MISARILPRNKQIAENYFATLHSSALHMIIMPCTRHVSVWTLPVCCCWYLDVVQQFSKMSPAPYTVLVRLQEIEGLKIVEYSCSSLEIFLVVSKSKIPVCF